jgi:hypothetical protein
MERKINMSEIKKPSLSKTKTIAPILLNYMSIFLVATVWISTIIFGLYILAFYVFAVFSGELMQWNEVLPGLYDSNNSSATIGIGIHFIAGGIILILGCIQLINPVRKRYPIFHRLVGRLYIIASLTAAIGGLTFILLKGTIGGWVMDLGFSLYGIFMFTAAIQTVRYARQKQFEQHRAWALRLFALALGSWLYRIDYGFWMLLADGYAHTETFKGSFDQVMSFFFFIPNLIVAEIVIGRFTFFKKPIVQLLGALILFLVSIFLTIGSYFFIKHIWGPAIIGAFWN